MPSWLMNIAGGIANWNVIGKGSIADQLTVDKDKKLSNEHEMEMQREETYQIGLQTTTIPKIDAAYKMGRLTLSALSLILGFIVSMYAIYHGMDLTAAISAGAGATPGAVYNKVKGVGRK